MNFLLIILWFSFSHQLEILFLDEMMIKELHRYTSREVFFYFIYLFITIFLSLEKFLLEMIILCVSWYCFFYSFSCVCMCVHIVATFSVFIFVVLPCFYSMLDISFWICLFYLLLHLEVIIVILGSLLQDMESMVETMMQQLLSKEILHEPMKEIGERYPIWLTQNKAKLTDEEYTRYSRQYELIRDLNQVYETEPDNFNKVVELMQKMQECGQPPNDIVQELAPDFDLSALGQL